MFEGTEIYTYTLEDKTITIETETASFYFLFTSPNSGTFSSNDAENTDYLYSGSFNSYTKSSNTELIKIDIYDSIDTEDSETEYLENEITITYFGLNSLNSLIPTISLALGSTIDPSSEVSQDFTSSVDYTVTAEDGSIRIYTIHVNQAFKVTYDLDGGSGTPPIDGNHYILGDSVFLDSGAGLIKSGFLFSGWASTTGGSILEEPYTMPENHVILYAVWIPAN